MPPGARRSSTTRTSRADHPKAVVLLLHDRPSFLQATALKSSATPVPGIEPCSVERQNRRLPADHIHIKSPAHGCFPVGIVGKAGSVAAFAGHRVLLWGSVLSFSCGVRLCSCSRIPWSSPCRPPAPGRRPAPETASGGKTEATTNSGKRIGNFIAGSKKGEKEAGLFKKKLAF